MMLCWDLSLPVEPAEVLYIILHYSSHQNFVLCLDIAKYNAIWWFQWDKKPIEITHLGSDLQRHQMKGGTISHAHFFTTSIKQVSCKDGCTNV